ncbi:hypothetical protein O1L68_39605 [Streptomyces lydicus]|nr:hypothetical protein [Streptomyces lydicus]
MLPHTELPGITPFPRQQLMQEDSVETSATQTSPQLSPEITRRREAQPDRPALGK